MLNVLINADRFVCNLPKDFFFSLCLAIWVFKTFSNVTMQRDTGYKLVENIKLSGIGFIPTGV